MDDENKIREFLLFMGCEEIIRKETDRAAFSFENVIFYIGFCKNRISVDISDKLTRKSFSWRLDFKSAERAVPFLGAIIEKQDVRPRIFIDRIKNSISQIENSYFAYSLEYNCYYIGYCRQSYVEIFFKEIASAICAKFILTRNYDSAALTLSIEDSEALSDIESKIIHMVKTQNLSVFDGIDAI